MIIPTVQIAINKANSFGLTALRSIIMDGKDSVVTAIIKDERNVIEAIQVSYSLKDISTRKREIEGLLEALREFNLSKGIILTYDESDIIQAEEKKIDIIPVWQWLLRASN